MIFTLIAFIFMLLEKDTLILPAIAFDIINLIWIGVILMITKETKQ